MWGIGERNGKKVSDVRERRRERGDKGGGGGGERAKLEEEKVNRRGEGESSNNLVFRKQVSRKEVHETTTYSPLARPILLKSSLTTAPQSDFCVEEERAEEQIGERTFVIFDKLHEVTK